MVVTDDGIDGAARGEEEVEADGVIELVVLVHLAHGPHDKVLRQQERGVGQRRAVDDVDPEGEERR